MESACNFVIEDFLRPVIDIKLAKPYAVDFLDIKALIDTGAMRSVIKKSIADKLELTMSGVTSISSVTSNQIASLSSVRVRFPFNYEYEEKEVIVSANEMGYDFIIGMDILSTIDMIISNKDEKMVISLRFPPKEMELFI